MLHGGPFHLCSRTREPCSRTLRCRYLPSIRIWGVLANEPMLLWILNSSRRMLKTLSKASAYYEGIEMRRTTLLQHNMPVWHHQGGNQPRRVTEREREMRPTVLGDWKDGRHPSLARYNLIPLAYDGGQKELAEVVIMRLRRRHSAEQPDYARWGCREHVYLYTS